MSTVSRKSKKWHPTPPPPPSPKILHFPRSRRTRTRRRRKPHCNTNQNYTSLNGISLFDQDNHLLHGLPLHFLSSIERRERVDERENQEEEEEEKLKFQTSGRKKIVESKNGNAVMEEEIQDLSQKLEDLHNSSRIKGSEGGSCSNFRLENHHHKSTHEAMGQESKCSGRCKAIVLRIVEQVRAETEQWSQMQTMLEQVRGEMEELQASRDYWETRAHASECEMQSLRHSVEEWRERALDYEKQVNQLQLKLSSAKEKMHKTKLGLRRGENNVVLDVPHPLPVPLGAQLVKERLAFSSHLHKNYHKHEKDLFLEEMNVEENKTRTPNKDTGPLSLAKQLAKEKRSLIHSFKENRRATKDKGSKQQEDGRSRRYSNINAGVALNRSPLRDIGNSSPLARQNHRAAFVYDSPESSRIRESFRK